MLEPMSEWGYDGALGLGQAASGVSTPSDRRAGAAMRREQPIMMPWAYWWHRYVLRHQMAGPQEAGQVDIWHDEVCGRPFHMLARLPATTPRIPASQSLFALPLVEKHGWTWVSDFIRASHTL
jgi:hypothetical protein